MRQPKKVTHKAPKNLMDKLGGYVIEIVMSTPDEVESKVHYVQPTARQPSQKLDLDRDALRPVIRPHQLAAARHTADALFQGGMPRIEVDGRQFRGHFP